MQAAQVQDVQVERQREYRVSPQWKANVVESCVNRYRMKIDPLSFSTERASFSWRSPGVGVIMSPNAFLECSFTVSAPTQQDLKTMLAPTYQLLDTSNQATGGDVNSVPLAGYGSKICFGSGDAFGRAITNYQLVVNGASLNNARQNLYIQPLQRCWFGESVFARRFSCCGGAQDQYDATPCSGVTAHGDLGERRSFAGFTGDSGISRRIKGYLNCVTAAAEGAERVEKTITVRWPVNGCGIFSPIGAQASDTVADSCPYKRSAYALAHMNVVSLDILFKDLKECLFRNLSRGRTVAPAGADRAGNGIPNGIQVGLVDNSASLHLEYMRLASWRGIPANVNLQCFRIAVHTASKEDAGQAVQAIHQDLTRSTVAKELKNALVCIGEDGTPAAADQTRTMASFAEAEAKMVTAEWNGIVSAQVPSYLFFCLVKSSDVFVLGGDAADDDGKGKAISTWDYRALAEAAINNLHGNNAGTSNYFLSRNTDATASIEQISLEIQSSVGAYSYSDDSYPYMRTRQQLFRDHIRYCADDYLQGDFDKWTRHQCCLLLGADSFIRGLATTGSSFPIQLTCKVKFSSRRQYVDGQAAGGETKMLSVFRDVIQGTPVMCQIYDGGSLSLTASSGVLSSQNLGHAQALDILSGRSRRQ